jgi:carboxyl-terminal processing protease
MTQSRTAGQLLLLAAIAFAGGALSSSYAWASTERAAPYHVLDQLARVLVLVENEYVEPVDRDRLLEGAIKGMVAELDPHSSYLPKQEYSIFQGDTEGRFGGVGVEVDFSNDAVTVIAPIEGSPAARAGVLPGDQIIAIDNQTVRGKSPTDLVSAMRGAPGSDVVLTLRRVSTDKLIHVKLTREVIAVASVASQLLSGNVGYVRIKAFQAGTRDEFVASVAKLRRDARSELAGILLDLRNNPGGLVDEAVGVTDEFLTSGTIYTTRHRGQVVDEVRASPKGCARNGPVAILVNEYSASAAELVAGALQDNHRGPLIGARTFGKGSVQTIIDLPGGAGLRLTTMRYYTPSGRTIQVQGVEPDVRVATSYTVDETFDVDRESDLGNHLPPSGPPGSPEPDAGAPRAASETDGGTSNEARLNPGRAVPEDPRGGKDLALSIAFQIVTGVLAKQP